MKLPQLRSKAITQKASLILPLILLPILLELELAEEVLIIAAAKHTTIRFPEAITA